MEDVLPTKAIKGKTIKDVLWGWDNTHNEWNKLRIDFTDGTSVSLESASTLTLYEFTH